MASICAFRFIKAILGCQLERRKYIPLSFLASFVIVLVYPSRIVGYIASLCYLTLLFFLFYRKKGWRYGLLYLFFMAFINFANLMCFKDYLNIRNGIVVISDVKGAFSYIVFPIFYLAIVLVTKMVDSLYHLRNYKTRVLIGSGQERKELTAYFDSGNTLRYRNCPIIFVKDGACHFKNEEKVDENVVATLKNMYGVKSLYKTLIYFARREESYFVYVAIKDDIGFNGCDALLNLYLGG